MTDYFGELGHWLDSLLGHFGIQSINGLDPSLCVLGAAIFLGFCAAVPSAIRMAFLRCSTGR